MKLNKTNREEIITAAIAAAFKTRDASHAKARTALADALYQHTHGEAEKIAKKLPAGWVAGRDSFTIVCDGFKRAWGGGSGAPCKMFMSRTRLFTPYSSEIKVDDNHQMHAAAQEVVRDHNAIESAKEELRAKLLQLVHSVATTEKLLEAWPECGKFLPPEVPKVSANLPVPANLVAQVNTLMGIRARA